MLSTTCQKIRCPNGIRGINLIKLEEENSIMKYHKNNILLSSKYLLQSLKLNFQKDQYLNSRFSIPKKSSPITFIPKLSKNVSSFLLIHFFKKWINPKITFNAHAIQIQSLDSHSNSCKNESGSNERGMRRNRQRCTTVFLDPLMKPLTY